MAGRVRKALRRAMGGPVNLRDGGEYLAGGNTPSLEEVKAADNETTKRTERMAKVALAEQAEIIPGLNFANLIADCVDNADRAMRHDGVDWSDKVILAPGVSPATHIAVGQTEGAVVEVDINQSSNPFTPARITCDLAGQHGEIVIEHNEVAQEGSTRETFALEDRASLDLRVTELFQKYFVD